MLYVLYTVDREGKWTTEDPKMQFHILKVNCEQAVGNPDVCNLRKTKYFLYNPIVCLLPCYMK